MGSGQRQSSENRRRTARERAADASPATTQRLARRLVDDPLDALAHLYARVTPAIHAYASLRLGERWLGPEDIVAEVWCRVSGHLADYDPSRPFRGWVFGFAQRVVKEAQRALARSRTLDLRPKDGEATSIMSLIPASITSVSARVAHDEEIRRFVRWVRDELSEYEREVLLLRGIQGRALADVAKALGRTERAVTVCWARILAKVVARKAPPDVLDPGA